MKTLPPHGDLARLREHMRNRKAMNDIEHVCKFIADFSDPSDPDHAAAIRCAYRLISEATHA